MNTQSNKYLIALDLDGTLLNSEQIISNNTKDYLNYLSLKGNIVTIASGRPPRSIKRYYEKLGLNGPFISYNGSYVKNNFDIDNYILKKTIKKEYIVDFILRFEKDYLENVMIEDDYNQYYLKENKEYTFFFHPSEMKVFIGDVKNEIKEDKLTFVFETKDTKNNDLISNYVESHYENIGIRYWYDAPNFGEFYFKDTNKGTSLLSLAKYYGIDPSHIIAFGDAMNDFYMLKSAGVSFAMKNGAKDLQKIATHITEFDNNHEGVYIELKKFFDDKF